MSFYSKVLLFFVYFKVCSDYQYFMPSAFLSSFCLKVLRELRCFAFVWTNKWSWIMLLIIPQTKKYYNFLNMKEFLEDLSKQLKDLINLTSMLSLDTNFRTLKTNFIRGFLLLDNFKMKWNIRVFKYTSGPPFPLLFKGGRKYILSNPPFLWVASSIL